jgi:hypothetical protein
MKEREVYGYGSRKRDCNQRPTDSARRLPRQSVSMLRRDDDCGEQRSPDDDVDVEQPLDPTVHVGAEPTAFAAEV